MATRGAKPKHPHLRVVEGTTNVTRHGSEQEQRARVSSSVSAFGKPQKPSYLKGQADWAWKRFIAPSWWLDASKEGIAIGFCELWKEFREDPRRFPASKHGQMRAYMSELGLTDERKRAEDADKDEPDEFFGDN